MAQQLLPRVTALQQMLLLLPGISKGRSALALKLAPLRSVIGQLDVLTHLALDPASGGSADRIQQALAAVTAGAQQAGVPECGMTGG